MVLSCEYSPLDTFQNYSAFSSIIHACLGGSVTACAMLESENTLISVLTKEEETKELKNKTKRKKKTAIQENLQNLVASL